MLQESPLILRGSGASRSASRATWLMWRHGWESAKLNKRDRQFSFGDGPSIRSSWAIFIFIRLGGKCKDSAKPLIFPVCVDVVDSREPILISHDSLRKMKGPIDFPESILTIASVIKIKSIRHLSPHLMIPCRKPPPDLSHGINLKTESVFAMAIRLQAKSRAMGELKKDSPEIAPLPRKRPNRGITIGAHARRQYIIFVSSFRAANSRWMCE